MLPDACSDELLLRGARTLSPNALLILAAIEAATAVEGKPRTETVAHNVGRDSAWLHRHGRELTQEAGDFARLLASGRSHLTAQGRTLAWALRRAEPGVPPHDVCRECGRTQVGAAAASRQLFACGGVDQWCPDQVPGLAKPDIAPRAQRAQHAGLWFRAVPCGGLLSGHWDPADEPRNVPTVDGTRLRPGLPVAVCAGASGSLATRKAAASKAATGRVVAAANGTALVDWHLAPVLASDLVPARVLIVPGAPDDSGLTDFEFGVWQAIQTGKATVMTTDAGASISFEGRFVPESAVAALVDAGLLKAVRSEAA